MMERVLAYSTYGRKASGVTACVARQNIVAEAAQGAGRSACSRCSLIAAIALRARWEEAGHSRALPAPGRLPVRQPIRVGNGCGPEAGSSRRLHESVQQIGTVHHAGEPSAGVGHGEHLVAAS